MNVSVILPTYNEAGNIVGLVEEILSNIPSGVSCEILVVDDNSPDHTYDIAKKAFEGVESVRVVLRTKDRGFARSIRHGIELAAGEYVIVMDTDFTHDPVEIPRMLHVAKVYDIVSGSRFAAGGNMQDTRHYLASLAYNWLIRVILKTQIQDNLGGYWISRREPILALPGDQIFYGYGEYFFRMLHFAQKRGMTVVEIPTLYRARVHGKSKSNFLKMLFTYSRAALQLRYSSRRPSSSAPPANAGS